MSSGWVTRLGSNQPPPRHFRENTAEWAERVLGNQICMGHQRLVLENLALRQQLNVLRRSVKRPALTAGDKAFWQS